MPGPVSCAWNSSSALQFDSSGELIAVALRQPVAPGALAGNQHVVFRSRSSRRGMHRRLDQGAQRSRSSNQLTMFRRADHAGTALRLVRPTFHNLPSPPSRRGVFRWRRGRRLPKGRVRPWPGRRAGGWGGDVHLLEQFRGLGEFVAVHIRLSIDPRSFIGGQRVVLRQSSRLPAPTRPAPAVRLRASCDSRATRYTSSESLSRELARGLRCHKCRISLLYERAQIPFGQNEIRVRKRW